MKKISILLLALVMLGTAVPAFAQEERPHVYDTTRPISATLRGFLNDWLAVDAPSDAVYYIVTYTEEKYDHWLVSLAGVSDPEGWSLEEDSTIWLGTVRVNSDGTVAPFSAGMAQAKRASLKLGAGGGAYVAFPFSSGGAALYGPRGVHGSGDYGTSGMLFVDLVSGDDMGVSAASPTVYASDDGEVDYVCDDGVSVAVRTYNSTTGDYFLYAHLLDNANLTLSEEFQQGEVMGSLKYGTFQGPPGASCGWAEQHAKHYHVHWGFVPGSGKFQVGSCVLTISTQAWLCGGQTIQVGGWLTGGGGFTSGSGNSGGTSGAGSAVTDPTFFDYFVAGFTGITRTGLFNLLPSHQPFEFVYALYNTVDMFFRLVYVLVQSNLALGWVFQVILYALGIKTIYYVISLVPLFFRALKWLVPVA